MDLNQTINSKLELLVKNGTVDQIIEKQALALVTKVIEDSLSYYGTIGKEIQQWVKDHIKIDLSATNIDTYNHNVSALVGRVIEERLTSVGIAKMEQAVKDMLDREVPTGMKISDLVDKFKEQVIADASEDSCTGDISFYAKPSGSYLWLHLDEQANVDHYRCKYRLMIDTGSSKLCCVMNDGFDFSKRVILGGLHGFDALLFRIYSAGTAITYDKTDVDGIDTYYSNEEDNR